MKTTKTINSIILFFFAVIIINNSVQASAPDFSANAMIGLDANDISDGKIVLKINDELLPIGFSKTEKIVRWHRVDFTFDDIDLVIGSGNEVPVTLPYPMPTSPKGVKDSLNYGFVSEDYDSEKTKLPDTGYFGIAMTSDNIEIDLDTFSVSNLWIVDLKAEGKLLVDSKKTGEIPFEKSSSATYIDDKLWFSGGGISGIEEDISNSATVERIPNINENTLIFTSRSGVLPSSEITSMTWVVKSGKITVEYFDDNDQIQFFETPLGKPIEIEFVKIEA